MDIVIPFKNSSSNGLELRYTLRGIQMYFGEVENVFLIGDQPEFIQNVIHIPFADDTDRKYKQRNIHDKLIAACNDARVSDAFAWVSDDQFLLKPFQALYNHRATVQESILNFSIHQTYRLTLLNTYALLNGGQDYGHYPMVLEKEKLVRAMEMVDWTQPWGYAIKTLYCALNGISGALQPDLKIKEPLVGNEILKLVLGRSYFSIADRGLNVDMKGVLQKLFPNKSIYEND